MKFIALVLAVLLLASLPSTVKAWGGVPDELTNVFDWLWKNIGEPFLNGIKEICGSIVGALAAPFTALVNVWNNWWMSLLGFGWYSPIVGIFVVAICFIIIALLWKLQPYVL